MNNSHWICVGICSFFSAWMVVGHRPLCIPFGANVAEVFYSGRRVAVFIQEYTV